MRNYSVCQLSLEQGEALRSLLSGKGFEFGMAPYTHWTASARDLQLSFYTGGKLVVQGKGTGDFVQFILEPEILKSVSYGYEAHFAVQQGHSHIGVDESGKGDFFGPLVVAAVYVEKEKLGRMLEAGVKDSKKLSSAAVNRLSGIIRSECPFSVVAIGPERYNALYENIKNLNSLLAWAHARAIENLLDKVDCQSIVIDQFAKEHVVLNSLMKRGKGVKVTQMHQGEQDLAVAAASIVARKEFLDRLDALSRTAGVELPRGAGAQVEKTARKICESGGPEALNKLAKQHFKITQRLMGQNESSGR